MTTMGMPMTAPMIVKLRIQPTIVSSHITTVKLKAPAEALRTKAERSFWVR